MYMITEYYEWCRSIEPTWVGFVVWISVVILAITVVLWVLIWIVIMVTELLGRIGAWAILPIPAFIAYCFYIAVFAQ